MRGFYTSLWLATWKLPAYTYNSQETEILRSSVVERVTHPASPLHIVYGTSVTKLSAKLKRAVSYFMVQPGELKHLRRITSRMESYSCSCIQSPLFVTCECIYVYVHIYTCTCTVK